VLVCLCIDNESNASSRQSSSVRHASCAGVNGVPLPVTSAVATLSRSASSASVKATVFTDGTKLPAVAADSCKHGKHSLKCVSGLFSVVQFSLPHFITNN